MKKISAMVAILALVLLTSSTSVLMAQSEGQKALLGTWDIELISQGMQMEFIFKMEEDQLKGEMSFEMGAAELEDITLEEGTLTFMAALDAGGQTINIDAEAVIEGESMTGTMFTDMGDVEFTGTKRKDQ